MRFVAAVMVIVFSGFALLQYDDPDGILWAMIYSVQVLVSLVVALGRPPMGLPTLALMFAAGAAFLSPELFQREWIHSEVGRESAGLIIGALWMLVLLIAQRRGSIPASS